MAGLRIAAVLAVLAGGAALGGWHWLGGWAPARADYPMQGADVSAASGAIDWPTMKANGADFGYALATSGAGGRDAAFAGHWAAMAEAGVRRGAIHRFDPCGMGDAQAANFIRTVPRDAEALPAAVEIDAPCPGREPARVLRELVAFTTAVEHHVPQPLLIRLSPEAEEAYGVTAALARPIWSTRLMLTPDYTSRPWRLWQANPARRVAGAENPVGWDVVAR